MIGLFDNWIQGSELTRFLFLKGLGLSYFFAFLILQFQFKGLLGEKGILPAAVFIKRFSFKELPSIFHWGCSDSRAQQLSALGLVLSSLSIFGLSDFNLLTHLLIWGALWFLYLSFVNIGQTFYGFGWESLLLETGFLAIFFGPATMEAPELIVWLLRWLLFRLMFGAGLIKFRVDRCWWDLTCLNYHFETQPSPGPLSWYFHHLPKKILKAGVAFNHLVELGMPLFYFAPAPLSYVAGILTILFQLLLIVSGNFSWFNSLSIVIALSCFDDAFWSLFMAAPSSPEPLTLHYSIILAALFALIARLSIAPVRNLISSNQAMNASFDRWHLVNTYGAFGMITRTRDEIEIEGTDVEDPSEKDWKVYLFKGKPCEVERRPPQATPYHWKLDWQMWFAAMSSYQHHPWFISLMGKLLQGTPEVCGLLRHNPFPHNPPKYVRAKLYRYRFSSKGEKNYWNREFQREYFPATSLHNLDFVELLKKHHWLDPV